MTGAAVAQNPLLIGEGLPPFDRIAPEHVVPGMRQLLQELEQELSELEAKATPTWEGTVAPLARIEERLDWSWGIVNHLMGVKNSSALRQAHEQVQPEVVRFGNRLSQSAPIYRALKQLRDGPDWERLDRAQQRIVDAYLQDAELSGVGLEGERRERFNAIQLELAELSTQFSNHVLDATQAFQLRLTHPDEVAGLPESALRLAAQAALDHSDTDATAEAGPWVLTLDIPSFLPFMQHAQRRDLRERLYRAFVTRASGGEYDNNAIIERILALRQEQAQLLGFNHYAELSLTQKMAPDVAAVERLLEELRGASYDAAAREVAELQALAAERSAPEGSDFQHWDFRYWAERQREARFELDAEALRPYFPFEQVLDGLFALVQRLFGVTIEPADGETPVWHPDVRYFRVRDCDGSAVANFYLDPYSRPSEKRGGAWMDECLNRARFTDATGNLQTRLPVAYLNCNQAPPLEGQPSLMTFDEVETLFHEFGHGLQHMLTQVDYPGAAGINNVEWDAVELPSQFMENWCYHRPTLFAMARHYQTGEPLPEAEYQKLLAARTHLSGSATLRQVYFSYLDLELHQRYRPDGSDTPWAIRDRVAERTTILQPLPEDAFLCFFGHIFDGPYAAGYYSYEWAEVLSADAFAAFEEAGLADDAAIAATGRRFRDTVLALGGSHPPMEVFRAFRGREPQTEPLLRHSGLKPAA